MKRRLAIFASGSGTNAENIICYFQEHSSTEVVLVLSNKTTAKVLDRAENLGVETCTFNRSAFYDSDEVTQLLAQKQIDYVVLAGFMWLIPNHLLRAFPDAMFNIHPSLLPAFGGQGMYGHHVHEAVLTNGEWQSGITIHLVNEEYDKGKVLFQASCLVRTGDSAHSLARRVHQLEYTYYPQVIERYISDRQG